MSLTRQISLAEFSGFGRNLRDALTCAGLSDGEQFAACETHLNARCAVCGMMVNGRALATAFLAAEAPEPSAADPLSRLRLGYCVDRSCSSGFYEFTFAPHPAVEWERIPLHREPDPAAVRPSEGLARVLARGLAEVVKANCNRRAAAALALLLALWIARQWVNGGRIPFIREPKTYTGSASAEMSPSASADDN